MAKTPDALKEGALTTVAQKVPLSYKKMMEGLYIPLMDVPVDTPKDVLALCVGFEAKTAQTKNKLALNLDIVSIISERIDASIGKIPKTNKLLDNFKQESNLAKQDIEKLRHRSDELLQEFRQFTRTQREEISEYIIHNPKRTKEDYRHFKKLENELDRFGTTIKQFKRDMTNLHQNLISLNNKLPVETRAEVTAPTIEPKSGLEEGPT